MRCRVLAPFLLALPLLASPGDAQSPAQAQSMNRIQQENARRGTRDWLLTRVQRQDDELYSQGWRRRKLVEAYAERTSLRAGDSLVVRVSTDPARLYTADVYRMGYYGGDGARLVHSVGPLQGQPQPTPADGKNHLVECRWTEGFTLATSADWLSGVYLIKLTTLHDGGQFLDQEILGESYVIFVLRDDRPADLLFQVSDMTWLSYNRWPNWRSLYDNDGEPWGANNRNPGYDVSFDKPYALFWNGFPAGFHPLTNGSGEFLMTEFPLAFWLEKEGYDVSYISNIDTHADGPGLQRGKAFLSVGHDEYWTQQMFDNVTKARDAGVSLAFLSGNSVSGVVELLPSHDGRPHRIMRRAGRSFSGEEELMGGSSYGVGFADWTCDLPDHWIFEGTGMAAGDRVEQLVGWEYHGPPLGSHEDLTVLSQGPVYGWDGDARFSRRDNTQRTYATTIYTAPRGNLVFDAATCWWNLVLSTPPGFVNPPRRDFTKDDPRIQRITRNVLDRMIAVDVAR